MLLNRVSAGVGGAGPGGETTVREADETLVPGEVVYITALGKAAKARANADGTKRAVGIVEVGAAAGFPATIRTHGTITLADWTAITGSATLTPNASYYLSAATAGDMGTAAPSSGWVTRVGTAISANDFDVNPEPPIKL